MHLTVFKEPMGDFSTVFQLSKLDHCSYFPWMVFMHMDCWLLAWSILLPVWIFLSRDFPSVVVQVLQVGAGRCLVVFCEVTRGVKKEKFRLLWKQPALSVANVRQIQGQLSAFLWKVLIRIQKFSQWGVERAPGVSKLGRFIQCGSITLDLSRWR